MSASQGRSRLLLVSVVAIGAAVAVALYFGGDTEQDAVTSSRSGGMPSFEEEPELDRIKLASVDNALPISTVVREMERGDLRGAEAAIGEARTLGAQGEWLRLYGAEIARRRGEMTKARTLSAESPLEGTLASRFVLLRVDIELDRGDGSRALSRLAELPDQPIWAGRLVRRGLGELLVGNAERAEATFKEALALDPTWLDAHLNLNKVLAERGAWQEVLDATARAESIAPSDPSLHYAKALASHELRLPEARARAERAKELAPEDAVAHLLLARVLREDGDMEAELSTLRSAAAQSGLSRGDSARVFAALGNALTRRRDFEAALGAFGRAADRAKADDALLTIRATALTGKGACLIALQRLDEAKASLREALQVAPNFPPAARALADIEARPPIAPE